MPCSAPNTDISSGPSPNPIAGFGVPFSPSAPSGLPSIPNGQPEDLNALFDALQFITPANILKPALHSNYDRTVYDGIMNLMNQFMPFLSMYNMFLPVLNMIVCIIEIICAIPNPFKLIEKIQQLFRVCIPQFLALFPQFALIVMILSIINLLISLIEYIILEITNLVGIIASNILVIKRALTIADDRSIFNATAKIGAVLCAFQNLFVLLSLFEAILTVIQTILKLLFPIPPCGDNNNNDINCCSPDVCPSFIKNNTDINRNTGTLQYFNEASIDSGLVLPPSFGLLTIDIRKESWQFYDASASAALAFINITQAYDLPPNTTAIFFPTDATYDASTPPSQAPYLIDLRLFYTPNLWDVTDTKGPRFIRINNCILTATPSFVLSSYNNSPISTPTGVLNITGGSAFEDDAITPIVINGAQGSLNTLLHMAAETDFLPPTLNPTDGYLFTNVTYDFKIQHPVLLSKALITLGCVPSVTIDRTFVNTVFGNNANFTILNNLVLPDVVGAQACLNTAVAGLQSSVSDQTLAAFQATTTACLSILRAQAVTAGISLINAGFDPYKSTFTLTPTTQFTTQSIDVSVSLLDTNGSSLVANVAADIATTIASNIEATITFGDISTFTYDGYGLFNASITASVAGSGTIKIAYQNQTISTATLPANLTQSPTVTETVLDYSFIYSPNAGSTRTSVGDTEGSPRLGAVDLVDGVSSS